MRVVEANELEPIRQGEIPRHIGCIMDGNGRWAQMRGLSRSKGHEAAEPGVRAAVEACLDLGVQWLTVYAFSTENWKRSDAEVGFLMSFKRWLLHEKRVDELDKKNVRIRFVGERDDERIPAASRRWMQQCEARTADNTALTFVVAFNYGGRQEIARAAARVAEKVKAGEIEPAAVTADLLGQHLDAPDLPDPDLIIRTSGEQRLSNFLLWQTAYSELVFVPTYWPDFDRAALESAIAEYHRRERRFGGLIAQTGS
jgi:undecaprenyl diphosphate synthase